LIFHFDEINFLIFYFLAFSSWTNDVHAPAPAHADQSPAAAVAGRGDVIGGPSDVSDAAPRRRPRRRLLLRPARRR